MELLSAELDEGRSRTLLGNRIGNRRDAVQGFPASSRWPVVAFQLFLMYNTFEYFRCELSDGGVTASVISTLQLVHQHSQRGDRCPLLPHSTAGSSPTLKEFETPNLYHFKSPEHGIVAAK